MVTETPRGVFFPPRDTDRFTHGFGRFLRCGMPTDRSETIIEFVQTTKLTRIGTNFEKIASFLHVTQTIAN